MSTEKNSSNVEECSHSSEKKDDKNGDNESDKEEGELYDDEIVKKIRQTKIWLPLKTFDSNSQLNEFLRQENWKKNKTTRTTDGLKIYYYCGAVKYGKKSCAAKLYVFIREGTKFEVFRSGDHVHCEEGDRNPTISEAVQNSISTYVGGNMKFRAISHIIRSDEKVEHKPSDNQVRP